MPRIKPDAVHLKQRLNEGYVMSGAFCRPVGRALGKSRHPISCGLISNVGTFYFHISAYVFEMTQEACDYFPPEQEKILIEHVRGYDCLYNLKNKNYKDATIKNNCWRAIAKEMRKTDEACKNKWRSIRDWYTKKKKDGKLPTGSGTQATLMRARFENLRFLDTSEDSRNTICDVSEDEGKQESQGVAHWDVQTQQENDYICESVIDSKPPEPLQPTNQQQSNSDTCAEPSKTATTHQGSRTPIKKRPKPKSARTHFLMAAHNKLGKERLKLIRELAVKQSIFRSSQENDHLEKFFSGIAATVRNMPVTYQVEAKRRVSKIVLQLEAEVAQQPRYLDSSIPMDQPLSQSGPSSHNSSSSYSPT